MHVSLRSSLLAGVAAVGAGVIAVAPVNAAAQALPDVPFVPPGVQLSLLTVALNVGANNTGSFNAGIGNTGNGNIGLFNTGDNNIGAFNSGNTIGVANIGIRNPLGSSASAAEVTSADVGDD